MAELVASRQFARLETVSREVVELDLPPQHGMRIDELATWYRFLSLDTMKRTDEALQVGERFLEAFPMGQFRQGVELRMRALILERSAAIEGRSEFEKAMEELERDRRESEGRAQQTGRSPPDLQRMSLESRSCTAAFQHKQYRLAVERCETFWQAWRKSSEPRWFTALSHAELGQFSEARHVANELQKDDRQRARGLPLTPRPHILAPFMSPLRCVRSRSRAGLMLLALGVGLPSLAGEVRPYEVAPFESWIRVLDVPAPPAANEKEIKHEPIVVGGSVSLVARTKCPTCSTERSVYFQLPASKAA